MGNRLHRPPSVPLRCQSNGSRLADSEKSASLPSLNQLHIQTLRFTQPLSFNRSPPLHYGGVCQCYQQSVMPHHYIPTLSALSGCNPVTLAPPQLGPVCVSVCLNGQRGSSSDKCSYESWNHAAAFVASSRPLTGHLLSHCFN